MPARSHIFVLPAMLIALVFALTTGQEHASGFSYVQNGSFETGTEGWHTGSSDLATVGADEVPPVTGSMSLRVSPSGTFLVSQTIFALPPGSYTASASIRRTTPGVQIYFRAQITNPEGDGQQVFETTGTTAQWITLSTQIRLPRFADVQVVIGGSGFEIVYIDDVHLDGAPPVTATPTSTATITPAATVTVTPPSTRTGTPTRTPSATPTATEGPRSLKAEVENGGFEQASDDGAPAAWSHYGGELSLVSQPVHSGARAGRLESTTDSTKWLYQSVTINPGSSYALGAWVEDEDPSVGSASLRISWYDTPDATGRALATSDSTSRIEVPATGYQYLTTGGVLAPDTAHSARLRVLLAPFSSATAVVYVDDASFGPADDGGVPATAVPQSTDAADDTVDEDPGSAIHAVLDAEKRPSRAGAPIDTIAALPGIHIAINEVLYDSNRDGPDGENEWVELYNPGNLPTELKGWTLSDAAGRESIADVWIGAHDFAILAASDSFHSAYPDFVGTLIPVAGRIGNSLGNDGDRLALRDASGLVVDSISWGTDSTVLSPAIPDVPSGHSIERRVPGADTDAADDFVDNESPSPGAAIAPISTHPPHATLSSPAQILTAESNPWTRRLPWVLASVAGAALLLTLAWRVLFIIMARLRPHA